MKSKLFHYAVAVVACIAALPAHAACAPGTPALNPASITKNVVSGSAQTSAVTQLDLDCTVSDTATISTAASTYTSSTGGNAANVTSATLFTDAALTQPLYSNPIILNAASTHVSVMIYIRLSGNSGGAFSGMGAYSLTVPLTINSGAASNTVNMTITGNVDGTCSINNASVDFGSVESGTKPIRPVGLSLNCTQGLSWSMSQPAIATVGPSSGANNTAWVFSDAAGTTALYNTPLLGTGTGASQTVSTYVGVHGATLGSATVGTGAIAGSIPVTVSY